MMLRSLALAFLALLFAAAGPGARPAAAQGFVADQIEKLLSSDTMTVEIEGLSGALTGNLRIESVTASDPQGVFLTARDLAMDWSPLALVRSNVSIESLTAGQIVLERLPTGQPESPDSEGSGFSLPSITADIRKLTIGEFVLGEAIAGTRARLRADAALRLAADPTNLTLRATIDRLDQPGRIALNVAFAPDENQLTLDIAASEPQGGLVATLLDLADRPAVDLSIKGAGPLSDFMANGALSVGATEAATLTARATQGAEGRRVSLSLNVAAERFVPQSVKPYLAGSTALDATVLLAADGTYRIETGRLASDALALDAAGTLDLSGAGNDLTLALAAPGGGAIPLAFGAEPNRTTLSLAGMDARLSGALTAANVDLSARLGAFASGEYGAQTVNARATSRSFDLRALRGPLSLTAEAATFRAPEGLQQRFLTGPVRIALNGALTPAGLTLEPSEAVTETARLGVNGTAALDFSVFDLTLDSRFQTSALSAALVPIAGDETSVGGRVARAADGALSATTLSVASEGLTVTGQAQLAQDQVSADIAGRIANSGAVTSALSGAADFRLTASGPSDQPDVDLALSGNGLSINGRELADLEVEARGTLASAAPTGSLRISGTLDGQPLTGEADLETLANGERRISDIAIRQGPNAITGALQLTQAFAPVGTLTVAVEDIGPLAALGGLAASGDVNGTVDLRVEADATPVAAVDLTTRALSVSGADLADARIDLAVSDYLGIPTADGTVTAASLAAGTVTAADLDLRLSTTGAGETKANAFEADAALNGIPVALAGTARVAPGETVLDLSTLNAAIPDAPLRLAAPASIRIADGTTTLGTIRLDAGDGSASVSGTSGETLDLALVLDRLPAAIAAPFVAGIDARGTLTGTASVTGAADAPQASFALEGRDLSTGQTRGAGLPAIALDARGSYRDAVLALDTARATIGEGRLEASGTVGETFDLDIRLADLPAALANDFVSGLEASGTLSGEADVTGPRAAPVATFRLAGDAITAREIAEAGIAPLTLRVAGGYDAGTVRLDEGRVNVGDGSLTATGTIGDTLDLDLAMTDLPMGLANGFVPGLDASGTLSGTARATGPRTAPDGAFDITGTRITTAAIERSGTPPLSLRLTGTATDGTASLQTAVVNVGEGSLQASGTVGRTLDLDLALNAFPVALANGFVPDLNARGTLSGTADLQGTLAAPAGRFQLGGSGITARDIAEKGVPPLDLTASGTLADGTLTLGDTRVSVGDGSLTAQGTVGRRLDLSLALERLPVALANGFVEGLGAEGTLTGTGTATGSLSDPSAVFALQGAGLTTADIKRSGIAPLTLDVAGRYGAASATIERANVTVGEGSLSATGTIGDRLDLDLTVDRLPVGLANGFVEGLEARGALTGSARASGTLGAPVARFDVSGSGITTRKIAESGVAPLSLNVAGTYENGSADLSNARVDIGRGSIVATGRVGRTLDIAVTLDTVPVGLANGFVDGLGAQGTVSGTAAATGQLSNPDARFDLRADAISVAQGRAAGAPAVNANAAGTYRAGTVQLSAAQVRVGGGTISATGSAGAQALDLDIAIADLPASIAGSFAPGIAPQGTISGTANVSGSPSNPVAAYDIRASGVSIQQTRDAGVGALAITTTGRFADRRLTTDTRLSGSGLALTAAGSVTLAGAPQLDLAVNGTAPLALANRILAEGGRSIEGTVRIDARIAGPATQPNVTGTVSTAGARFVDTGTNLAINNISTTISLNGDRATIGAFSANLASGGRIAVGGSVALRPPFEADIRVQIVDGRYADGDLLSIQLSADLALTGPLTGTPRLSGTLNAREIDVIVPERLPTSLARIDVTHRNARPAVYRQQEELFPKGRSGGGGGGIDLDLTFNAPSRVFVRGRGLDIELGGSIRITGSAASPSIVGGFELQRGRFRVLSRRLDFERGILTFTGGLVPTLDLLATSDTGDVTVSISVTGPANDPSFTFSSEPALPQDEVLARLIFGQGTADLSPLQIAQLAEAAATLAGVGGSTGLLENLRAQLGVDDLDIKTTADGQTAVGVGKYLNDNTYLGVDSTGQVSIDLKLGGGLKARGAVSATGGGQVGVFYEGEF
ncbi:translocation/assembly module TamB domain-containing protein [Aurantimonas sp. Leaf443]|uniref:translocation/assembly module TamB domain-containing protein n=1 Tax=Aurantimonas sp. Leaf443 TaxID=1736378 RepID=UPI0006F896F6|nr:translocation/assembly module TamB domain-containing protein [Aurantimonas sp. Leaf443]KQT87989.1 hypothetical protein ASG48_00575 [Aurantimonas sp. Leaf443]